MTTFSRRSLAMLAAASALALLGTSAAVAQTRPKITVSSLTLPVFNPLVWNIMKARGLDAKHGFELDVKPYPSISAFYAAFSTGETEVVIGGPTILQKLYQEGVPLRIFGTGFTLSDLVVFAKDPNIKSLADLKGKTVGAQLGGDPYNVLSQMLRFELGNPDPKAHGVTQVDAHHVLLGDAKLHVDVFARGLDHPWALAFLPDGRLLATEKKGALKAYEKLLEVFWVNIDPTVKDRFGMPVAHVHFDDHANDVTMRDHAYAHWSDCLFT